MGPTLFLLYINDLCLSSIPNCEIFTYADDTALVVYDSSWASAKMRAENALCQVTQWLSTNMLTLNIGKTNIIRFRLPNTPKPSDEFNLIKVHSCDLSKGDCGCNFLAQVPQTRYLGVYIDEQLTWSAHINALCARIRKLIYVFLALRRSADFETLLMVYESLCKSIIMYCIPAWGGTYVDDIILVERAQRAILKIMTYKRRTYSTTLLYSDCKVLSVRQLFIFRTILRRHTSLPLNPDLLTGRHFKPKCPILRCRTAFAKRQYMTMSSFLYNKIDKSIDIYTLTIREIKQKLSKWLQNLTYDDTESLPTCSN